MNKKNKTEILGYLIKEVAKTEDGKATIKEVAKTGLTITKTVNSVLQLLAPINYICDSAHKYFQEHFNNDITEKLNHIPEEHRTNTKPSIAIPALQGLSYSLDEPELKEMYLNLLCSSMDKRLSNKTHPAYAEIIKQLSSDEAKLLNDLLSSGLPQIPITQLRDVESTNAYSTLQAYVLNIVDDETGEPICIPEVVSMIDNFIRLGLVSVDFNLEVGYPNMYDWADGRPEIELIHGLNKDKKLNIQSKRGLLNITTFAKDFAKVVGIHT